jgi:uncharacterized protein
VDELPNAGTSLSVGSDDKNWGVIAHVSALAGAIVPFGNILGPLVVMLTKGKESTFVGDHARAALNFQITLFVVMLVIGGFAFASMIGGGMGSGGPPAGFFVMFTLVPILMIANLVFIIIAAVAASRGEGYRYPVTLSLVR